MLVQSNSEWPNEPKYRSLDGEDNECRLCKHCGCMLNTVHVSQVAQRKLNCTLTGKRIVMHGGSIGGVG